VANTTTTLTWVLRDQVTAQAVKMGAALNATGTQAVKTTGFFDKLGRATGGLVSPTFLAIAGVTAFTGFLFEAAKGAAEEEQNIAKLTASLYANIPGWDGNTAAIEKQITAREDLAFSDDELRDSLALLVGATHDVQKAFAIQTTAMDLARFKGISLQDATEALTRVEGGQFRALKSLGIVLKDGATQTDALAAVQAVAAGQASAYGNTLAGTATRIEIKLHDVSEEIGKHLLPFLVKLADFLLEVAKALETVTKNLDFFIMGMKAAAPFLDTIGSIGNLPNLIPHRASGGVLPLHGPVVVGENGPETLVMNGGTGRIDQRVSGGGGDTTIHTTIQLDGRTIAEVVDKHQYRKLQRSAASVGRA
jgi:hypothetical protein